MDLSPSEPSSIYRHLTLVDLICLVLAVAAGLAACRFVQRVEVVLFPAELRVMDPNAWVGMGSTMALALAWMVVLRGASSDRSERLQFGYLGCLAVVVASGRMFLSNLSMTWRGWFSAEPVSIGSRAGYLSLTTTYLGNLISITSAVTMSWTVFFLTVGWK